MTPEEIVTGILATTPDGVPDAAFLNRMAEHLSTLSPNDFGAHIQTFVNAVRAAEPLHPTMRQCFMFFNAALNEDPRYDAAALRYHDWREAQLPPAAPEPSDTDRFPPSPDGVLRLDDKTRRQLEKKNGKPH